MDSIPTYEGEEEEMIMEEEEPMSEGFIDRREVV